ncbi:MAG TPA: hypothetical protein VK859_08045, partial [bacterium]|nr:hypothetical protein [bacterium]
MGGAFSAVADDPSAVYWNPAGLAWVKQPEIQTTYNQWFQDTFFQDLEGLLPTPWGGIGARLSYVNFGTFDNRDSSGNLLGTQTPEAWTATAAAAAHWGPFGVGLSLTADQENYANYNIGGLGMDAGALYRFGWASLAAGARNIGQAGGYNLPLEFYAGGAAYLGPPSFQLLLTTDATIPSGSPVLHHGLEWGIEKIFYLRGGYQWTLQPQQLQDQAGFGGGVGLHLGDFQMDYSITSNGDLGLTNKIAVGLFFGKPARPRAAPTPVRVASVPASLPAPAASPIPSAPAKPSPAPVVVASSGTQPAPEKMMTYYRKGIAEYKAGHFQPAALDLWKAVSLQDPTVQSYYYAEADLLLGVLYQFHAK